jgi:hypothetical protein
LRAAQKGITEKSELQKEFEKALSIDEARRQTHQFIESLPWKK